ncbi:hypothetical protein OK074_0452, partial [Actinobacteria bacterium OK074]
MTTVEQGTGGGPARQRERERIPFPVVDEVSRHCVQDAEPETVHIEIHLPGPLDPTRLRTAFVEALHRHPRILMREADNRWYSRRYEWELTAAPEAEVVTFAPPGEASLWAARERSLAAAPPLGVSPPVRLEVIGSAHGSAAGGSAYGPATGGSAHGPVAGGSAHGPAAGGEFSSGPVAGGGTALILTVNHTALDGPACLRILATAAELYSGRDNSPAPAPARAAAPAEPPPPLRAPPPPAPPPPGAPGPPPP